MPTPTRKGTSVGAIVGTAIGLCLYLLTVSLEFAVGGAARFLLIYPLAAVARIAIPGAPSPRSVAVVAALLPVVGSVCGLIVPGPGRWWRRRAGLRRPSLEEIDALSLAFALFAPTRSLPRVAILDDPLPVAAVRGLTVIVSRGLLESTSLAAVLAHECAHLQSVDGRLTEALERLSIWADPLGPSVDPKTGETVEDGGAPGGLLYGLLRLLVSLAGGGRVRQALCPLWSAHWRRREFAADVGAAEAGQGPDLVRHLRDEVLPFEISRERGVFDLSDHPPTALRIERLEQAGVGSGTK